MGVSALVWALTVAAITGMAVFDYVFHVRKAHVPALREAALWSAAYIGVAIAFGIGVVVFGGTTMGVEYFACYVSNEALSVDNLFVFLVIIGNFAVPRIAQQKVLLFGIVLALVARTGFIFVGAALITIFDWAFYVLSLVLLVTAGYLVKPSDSESRSADTVTISVAKRYLRTSDSYDGDRLLTVQNGKRVVTPMLLVIIAIGGADLLFAIDSVSAMFGLTQNVYVVFAATAFSLLGLRQLYFLIESLLDRLVFLSYGLAAILAFIGVKLMLQALRENNIPLINGGKPVPIRQLSTTVSLTVIVVILVITMVASLLSGWGQAQNAAARARRHATEYLDLRYEADPAEREKIYAALLAEEDQINALPMKYRTRIRHEDQLADLLRRAHHAHDTHNPG